MFTVECTSWRVLHLSVCYGTCIPPGCLEVTLLVDNTLSRIIEDSDMHDIKVLELTSFFVSMVLSSRRIMSLRRP